MRPLRLLEACRRRDIERELYGVYGDDGCGVFSVQGPRPASGKQRRILRVIASSGEGWDHVSVSLPDRVPTWAEMEHVKRLFFRDDETAMQLHVPPSEHIDCCTHCLHLWRPQEAGIPRPPARLVA